MSDILKFTTFNKKPRIEAHLVKKIICNRTNEIGEEEYLVRWKRNDAAQAVAYSWHILPELRLCLYNLQKYIDKKRNGSLNHKPRTSSTLNRKNLDNDDIDCIIISSSDQDHVRQYRKPVENTKLLQEQKQTIESRDYTVYNGRLSIKDDRIQMNVPYCIMRDGDKHDYLPTDDMIANAESNSTQKAEKLIRKKFEQKLAQISGPKVNLVNNFNGRVPSLNLEFIDACEVREGVLTSDPATIIGCQSCRPNMGQGKGCQYTRKCECLEYAAVDEGRLTEEEKSQFADVEQTGFGDTFGLPKRFPYYCTGVRAGCLVPFYLESNYVVYECNRNCPCGPFCKTRVVQNGRTIPLTIFKTADYGWGLRCPERLKEGQFIDTYRGEIITNAESTRREKAREGHQTSYLYSLDKFSEELNDSQSESYVIDGREHSGVTRFINHSCEPNCYQFAVSYNKHDFRIYDIAFFAARDIEANEELTFDYINNSGAEAGGENENDTSMKDAEEDIEGRTKCRCGASTCRGWLWNL